MAEAYGNGSVKPAAIIALSAGEAIFLKHVLSVCISYGRLTDDGHAHAVAIRTALGDAGIKITEESEYQKAVDNLKELMGL